MDLFRRIGTTRLKYKLEFFLDRILFDKKLPGRCYISIKRGEHKKSTENKVKMDDKHIFNFEKEILSFDVITLFRDDDTGLFQEKPGEIRVILIKEDNGKGSGNSGKKILGNCMFDVGKWANQKKENIKEKLLLDTPEGIEGTIIFQVFLKFIGEASETEKSRLEGKEPSSLEKIGNFFSILIGNKDDDESKRKVSPKKSEIEAMKEEANKVEALKREGKLKDKNNRQSRSGSLKRPEEEAKAKNKPIKDSEIVPKEGKRQRKIDRADDEEEFIEPPKNKRDVNTADRKGIKRRYDVEEGPENEPEEVKEDNKAITKSKNVLKVAESAKTEYNFALDEHEQQPSESSIFDRSIASNKPTKATFSKTKTKTIDEGEQVNRKDNNIDKQTNKNNTYLNKSNKSNTYNDEDAYEEEEEDNELNSSEPEPIITNQSKNKLTKPLKEAESRIIIEKEKGKKKSVKANPMFEEVPSAELYEDEEGSNEDNEKDNDKDKDKDNDRKKESNMKKQKQNKSIKMLEESTVNVESSQIQGEGTGNTIKSPNVNNAIQATQGKQPTKTQLQSSPSSSSPTQLQPIDWETKFEEKSREADRLSKENIQLCRTNEQLLKRITTLEASLASTVPRLPTQNSSYNGNNGNNIKDIERDTIIPPTYNQTELQAKLRTLEHEKNEQMVLLQKEKERYRKDFKQYEEQLEQSKEDCQELMKMSNAELQRVKEECRKGKEEVQELQGKLNDKLKENKILLSANNKLQEKVDALAKKLGGIKMKICERLNDANADAETEIIEVLTEIVMSMETD